MNFMQKFILAVLFTIFLLLGLELSFRGLHSLGLQLSDKPEQMQLQMPAWMLGNGSETKTFSAAELRWMDHFVSGEGFRVRLQPDIDEWFKDTFSWLQALPDSGFQVRSNALGFRGWQVPELKNDKSSRILVFGDSSSFGWGVNYEQSYAGLLQKAFALSNKGAQVLNFAMPGDSSVFGKLVFDRYFSQFAGDGLILSFGANDSRKTLLPHKLQVQRYQSHSGAQQLRAWMAGHSALFRDLEVLLAGDRSSAQQTTRTEPAAAVPLKVYKNNLRTMIQQARQAGVKKILLLGVCSPRNYRNAMKAVAEKEGAGFLDAQGLLRESIEPLKRKQIYSEQIQQMQARIPELLEQQPLLYVSSDGCHPNAIGHDIIAGKVKNYFLSSGL